MADSNRRDQVLDQLVDGIATLTTSDDWRRWLDVQAKFHHYSFGNSLLIMRQRPEATRVAGFHTWRKLGRCVRKGEKGIWILAPMTHRVADDNDDESDGSSRRILSGFRPVPVFDIAQTDGETLPDSPVTRLAGEAPEHAYERLVAVAHGIGYAVEEDYLPGERNGVCAFDERCIRVEVTNDAAQQVKTLAHELAHAMLHEGSSDRALAELEAESVAYIVCNGIGLESDTYSFGYVAGWAGGGDTAIAAIKASGQRIQQTANRILESVTTATSCGSPPGPAVQLLLRLPGVGSGRGRRARSRAKPYWLGADAVDLGGSLRARSQWARVTLDAEQHDDGTWRGQYDLWLPSSGIGGATKLMPLRRDALASAAHPVAAHCRRVVEAAEREPRTAVRGAREILRWLAYLDLL